MLGGRAGGMSSDPGDGGLGWDGRDEGREGEEGTFTFTELAGDLDFLAFVPVVVVYWFDTSPRRRFRGSGGCEISKSGSEGQGGDDLVKKMHCEFREVAMDRVWL